MPRCKDCNRYTDYDWELQNVCDGDGNRKRVCTDCHGEYSHCYRCNRSHKPSHLHPIFISLDDKRNFCRACYVERRGIEPENDKVQLRHQANIIIADVNKLKQKIELLGRPRYDDSFGRMERRKLEAELTLKQGELNVVNAKLAKLSEKPQKETDFEDGALTVENFFGGLDDEDEDAEPGQETDPTPELVKETTNPMATNKLKNLFGTEIGADTTGNFKMSMLGIAVKNNEGNYMAYNGNEMVDTMDMTFDMDDMIFKMPSPTVVKGDLIIAQGGQAQYVKEVNADGSILTLNPFTSKIETIMPASNMFNFKFFIKVVSMFNMQQNQNDPMSGLAMAFMFMGDDEGNDGKSNNFVKMFAMMSMMKQFGGQAQNEQPAANPMAQMMPAMMMSQMLGKGDGNGNMKDMMQSMFMMSAMQQMMGQGGQGFQFPFFGQPAQQPVQEPTKQSNKRGNNKGQAAQAAETEAE